MGEKGLVDAHGGRLVDRTGAVAEATPPAVTITLSAQEQCDFEMIAIGAVSPLEGFMGEADYTSVCDNMTLEGGAVWPIPITCSVAQATADGIEAGQRVALNDDAGRLLGYLNVREKYRPDKRKAATKVFLTQDEAHPGVKVMMGTPDTCLAGPIDAVTPRHDPMFVSHRLTPAQIRAEFQKRGWRTVAAFQTRNPIHRAHEYLTKCAQEITDGLLIHPLMGATKDGDIPPEVRMKCYQVLIDNYYHPEHTMLAIIPAAMRYAGPREAILHAIYRQNCGCSHFIVGRDHAGVGDYYGEYDAHALTRRFDGELGIEILRFHGPHYCARCDGIVTERSCPHAETAPEAVTKISGTDMRAILTGGGEPKPHLMRPEIVEALDGLPIFIEENDI